MTTDEQAVAAVLADARKRGAQEARQQSHDLLMRLSKQVEASEGRTPPPGFVHTSTAEWLRFAAGDVLRGVSA